MGLVDLSRKAGESELEYIKRIGEAKENGLIDMTWRELADVFNNNLRDSNTEWTESAYRKKYASLRKFAEEFGTSTGKEADDLSALRRELEKERIKLRDERTAYNKLIRDEARKESYQEQFIKAISEAAGKHPLRYDPSINQHLAGKDTVIVACLTDVHMGISIHNHWNTFDEDILRQMLNYYIDYITDVAIRHKSADVVILASELVSGLIHPSIRLQNNQDLIEQFLTVTDYICDFLTVLSTKFKSVKFYVAPGNHSRLNPKKDDGLDHENMDNLVVPFVRNRLQQFPNIKCYDNEIDSSIATASILGNKLVFVHGDKDTMDNVTSNMTRMLGYTPDIIVLGHRHFNAYSTENTTKIVQSGSFMSVDEYAANKRLIGKPEQTVLVVSPSGLECIYDVQF